MLVPSLGRCSLQKNRPTHFCATPLHDSHHSNHAGLRSSTSISHTLMSQTSPRVSSSGISPPHTIPSPSWLLIHPPGHVSVTSKRLPASLYMFHQYFSLYFFCHKCHTTLHYFMLWFCFFLPEGKDWPVHCYISSVWPMVDTQKHPSNECKYQSERKRKKALWLPSSGTQDYVLYSQVGLSSLDS